MALNPRSFLLRASGLLVLLVATGLFLGHLLREKRTGHRVRTMLLTVQEGLQRYHVKEELYPKKPMRGGELVQLLRDAGFLEKTVLNPWTGLPYGASPGSDWLQYRTNGLAETYELVVSFPDSEEVQFRLDSTEHQSLE